MAELLSRFCPRIRRLAAWFGGDREDGGCVPGAHAARPRAAAPGPSTPWRTGDCVVGPGFRLVSQGVGACAGPAWPRVFPPGSKRGHRWRPPRLRGQPVAGGGWRRWPMVSPCATRRWRMCCPGWPKAFPPGSKHGHRRPLPRALTPASPRGPAAGMWSDDGAACSCPGPVPSAGIPDHVLALRATATGQHCRCRLGSMLGRIPAVPEDGAREKTGGDTRGGRDGEPGWTEGMGA